MEIKASGRHLALSVVSWLQGRMLQSVWVGFPQTSLQEDLVNLGSILMLNWLRKLVCLPFLADFWVCGSLSSHFECRFTDKFICTDGDKEAKPRIWYKTAIERDGHVIGGADSSSVLPGDFVLPSDESSQQPLSIKLESLDLFAAAASVHDTPTKETPTPLSDMSEPPEIGTYSAMMRFSVDADGEEMKEVNLALSNDVHFVTAFPCVSSSHTGLLKSPTSPSFHIPEQSRSKSSTSFVGRSTPFPKSCQLETNNIQAIRFTKASPTPSSHSQPSSRCPPPFPSPRSYRLLSHPLANSLSPQHTQPTAQSQRF